ncbi:DUF2213 domain-containing protein [Pararhizobium mangrovi]|uniref:DUF2213 domain-containing protein n=1 Tax=Pararhizobium mangrovi TaxID=2590452 RepID=A0A506TZ74_9HYPH|nr:DUF2213 domain-containing protein [Pararhizobium mangrovi]TPW26025.1 DUF2213 domain-containing protein [Pararhizobium mangrovi]
MNFTDATELSGVRTTADGYLIADSYALRTGIQTYLGSEVGRDDLDQVAVYRPEEEVFSTDSLASLSHAPITDDHPDGGVNSETWAGLGKGEVSSDVLRDGNRLRIPLIVKDKATVQKVQAGKRQLSAGYTASLVWGDGVTPEGEPYQAKQTGIRFNHLAIVDKARAGDDFRIGDGAADRGKGRTRWGAAPLNHHDHEPKGHDMTMSTVVLGDKAVQVAATDAPAIEAFKTDAARKMADAEKAHSDAIAAKDKELADRDTKIEGLEKKVLSDEDLDKRVKDRAQLISDARKIDPNVKVSGVSDGDIRKAVVASKLGQKWVDDRSEAYIEARFDGLLDTADTGNSDPLRDTGPVHANDGGSSGWNDSVFQSAGVALKKEG